MLEPLVAGVAPVTVGRGRVEGAREPRPTGGPLPGNPANNPGAHLHSRRDTCKWVCPSPNADCGCLVIGSITILNIFEYLLYAFHYKSLIKGKINIL